MQDLAKIGRLLYGIGIAALGVHQLIIKDFRPEILPPFPTWAHSYTIIPIFAGIALIIAGIIISGLLKIKTISTKNICLYLGFCFLILIIGFQLLNILIISSNNASRLDGWFGLGEELAYCGGAFVMAGSFPANNVSSGKKNFFISFLEKLIPAGRIFYSLLIILFGCSHFVFPDFVSTMVPKWLGLPMFWTYFVGSLLIASGIAIIFKIWTKTIALLLAIMLFLFFLFFHVPDAIAHPKESGGAEIVRAIVALLFCGIALVISSINNPKKIISE
ncbi:MAG TPA: hypothetical protein VKT28_11675 [Puia sp.]|nr:hypothetical protein [Puia sp.]